ncbi:hypothetical protein ZWY2020_042299 [Hordeum vulgare]|nr:hypothetical protein ZWY2020_042299 [Hordeum vulgare]
MRVSDSWRPSAGRVPLPPPPCGADRRVEIARIRSSLPESSRNLPRYAPVSNTFWMAYFKRLHADQLAATNGVKSRVRHNSEGRRQLWGVPGCTLKAVLEHIEGDDSPRYEYTPPPAFSRRGDGSWMLRRMKTTSSSSSASRSRSSGSSVLLPVKLEPREMTLGRRMRSGDIVINEPDASSRLVKPKMEPTLLPVKHEHLAMVVDDETTLKWARGDYVREEMERERHTPKEIAARRRSREEDDAVILEDSDEEAPKPSNPIRHSDPRQGCSKDGGGAQDDDENDDDTNLYKLLGV